MAWITDEIKAELERDWGSQYEVKILWLETFDKRPKGTLNTWLIRYRLTHVGDNDFIMTQSLERVAQISSMEGPKFRKHWDMILEGSSIEKGEEK